MNDFKNFNLSHNIIKSITSIGYRTPSEVQEKVIPLALEEKDLIVKSQTGSGKTASFGIPICERLETEKNAVQALILTPTRELSIQVKNEISKLGLYKKIKAVSLYGKEPFSLQKKELSQRVHVVVGTPGRVLDHITRKTFDIKNIKYLVIDEADEMLNMGFISQVENIIKTLPNKRQTMMFSATLSEEIKVLSKKYMNSSYNTIEISPEKLTLDNISQCLYIVEDNKKLKLLVDLIKTEDITQAIIFCRTKERVSDVYEKLKKYNLPLCEIHGNMLQKDRLNTIKGFREGKYLFMVATDVAARGIDISTVSHVINYDLPLEVEAYVHRIGRTGRAGETGTSYTFATPYEDKFLKAIEEFISMKIPIKTPPSKEEIKSSIHKEFKINIKSPSNNNDVVKIFINGGKKKKIRRGDIVGALTNNCNIPSDSIGIIDIYDTYSNVDILNGYGKTLLKTKNEIDIKGKSIKIKKAKLN
ncbi:DEAD/DEAH box helicase [Clostridium faecium]|uniref:DEAD/DEAH box helicase n=1 Tax=Clostridium faecium TaxID=2762223 RepID=A0ABR8YQM8_9CLOT|nr:DEAD/DEAH box helicase [Clostridium faecium]MBD8046533.1 DEAD/DEAH box helicase [Clostridium faecium]